VCPDGVHAQAGFQLGVVAGEQVAPGRGVGVGGQRRVERDGLEGGLGAVGVFQLAGVQADVLGNLVVGGDPGQLLERIAAWCTTKS
jgi:hypothetical protein